MLMNTKSNPWMALTIFAIAMGLLETIVVIYLRELYYPEGFAFPVKAMEPHIVSIELLRELATILMLVTIGIISGRNFTTRFAWFLYSFAIWDIFYYIFLKVLVQWPESLLTWDILFLIPVTWAGPVLAPVINSLTMILLAALLIKANNRQNFPLKPFEWALLLIGSVIIIIAYTQEYVIFMLKRFTFQELLGWGNINEMISHASTFIPFSFNWILFLSGVMIHVLAIGSLGMRKGVNLKI